jgi:hypothetical protein
MEMRPIHTRRDAVQLGRASRLVLAATVGRATLDARLAALAPLRQALGPASVALFDDGTLAGADRVRIARACGDPLILAANGRVGDFPPGPDWALLLAALEQRRNAYWVTIGDAPPEHAIPDLAQAIASNRCFGIVDDGTVPEALTAHLEAMAGDGFPHIHVSAGLLGFAACGDGLAFAAAVFARLEAVLGKPVRPPEMARAVAGFVLAREREPVLVRDKPGAVHSPGRISML